MTREPQTLVSPPETQSARLIVHLLMQFLMAVRYRKNVVIVSVAVAGGVGAAYFVTATRYYRASAEMLMIQTGIENLDSSMTDTTANQRNMMKTFEKLVVSPKVLEGAIERL